MQVKALHRTFELGQCPKLKPCIGAYGHSKRHVHEFGPVIERLTISSCEPFHKCPSISFFHFVAHGRQYLPGWSQGGPKRVSVPP